ncbi:MAG: hypothetical protein WC023_03830 [Rhodocyclaceae bacterium]|jgi:hypothetical protein
MTETPAAGQVPDERRRNTKLRSLFDTAYIMIEPFFDPDQGWGGHSLEHLAFRVLRENFSQLSSEEVHTIIVVAHRVYIQKNPGRSSHLRRPDELRLQNL